MSDKPKGPPKWYNPNRLLVALVDGPRAGQWFYADRWENERRLAEFNGEVGSGRTLGYVETEQVEVHPQDMGREDVQITGTVWRWEG